MKYYLIVGEASGDLHASHLMRSLKEIDREADFRFFGGDLMAHVCVITMNLPIWALFLCCSICQQFLAICGCVNATS